MRNELDRRSHPGDAEYHQDDASHQRRDDQSVDTEALHDSVNDYDERSGRSSDLDTRSTQRRDQKASHDCRIDSGLRRRAGSYSEGHGQRESYQSDCHAGDQIRD